MRKILADIEMMRTKFLFHLKGMLRSSDDYLLKNEEEGVIPLLTD
jgi:hypothetical protein